MEIAVAKQELIRPLKSTMASTLPSSGMAKLNAHRKDVKRVIDMICQGECASNMDINDSKIAYAWMHETTHFIQAISTNYLYSYGHNLFYTSLRLLENFASFISDSQQGDMIRKCRGDIYQRKAGISAMDICEGMAVLEAFRMARKQGNVLDFLQYRDDMFPGNHESPYRRTFDTLAFATDPYEAFNSLTPLSFISLQSSESPGKLFNTLVERIKNRRPDTRDLIEFIEQLGIDPHNSFPWRVDEVPKQGMHPVLYRYAKGVRDLVGAERFFKIGLMPSLLFHTDIGGDTVSMFFPPLIANSYYHGEEERGSLYGYGASSSDFYWLVSDIESMIGAAERTITFDNDTGVYMCCPYEECPHFRAAFCHRKYPPPNVRSGWEKCSFPRDFKKITGRLPNTALEELQHKISANLDNKELPDAFTVHDDQHLYIAYSLDDFCREHKIVELYQSATCTIFCPSCERPTITERVFVIYNPPESITTECPCGRRLINYLEDFAHFTHNGKRIKDLF
jgi:hypothetical protein